MNLLSPKGFFMRNMSYMKLDENYYLQTFNTNSEKPKVWLRALFHKRHQR